jgi:hypothetical protein
VRDVGSETKHKPTNRVVAGITDRNMDGMEICVIHVHLQVCDMSVSDHATRIITWLIDAGRFVMRPTVRE